MAHRDHRTPSRRAGNPHFKGMAPAAPIVTFAELERRGLEIEVTCQKCGHRSVVNGSAPKLRDLPVAGRRFRCTRPGCGGIGLPTIGKQRLWTQRQAEHARSLQQARTRPVF